MDNQVTWLNDTYAILNEIGSGGFGKVFLGYHNRLQKHVVIKRVPRVDYIDTRVEADILKNLHHEYLPQVFDYIIVGDDVYTVMDYIPGKSLGDYIKEGYRFSHNQVYKYAKQLCEAVRYLHSRNVPIIHGDIKPDNIMLTPDDNICLIDFNVSGFLENLKLGGYTKGYASPEQAYYVQQEIKKNQEIEQYGYATETEPVVIDGRSDIYSIGATIYFLLTGIKPSSKYDTVPISKLDMEISDGFAYVIDKAMSYNPSDRFQTVDEMIKALFSVAKKDRRYRKKIFVQNLTSVIVLAFAAVFAVVAVIGYRTIQSEKTDALYESATKLYDKEKYDECYDYIVGTALIDEKLFSQEELGNLYYIAGECCFKKEDYKTASRMYEAALEHFEGDKIIFCNYAIALAYSGKSKQALQALSKAEKKHAADAYLNMVSGEIALSEGDYYVAREDFLLAIDKAQDEGESYVLSRSYIKLSQCYLDDVAGMKKEQHLLDVLAIMFEAENKIEDSFLPILYTRIADVSGKLAEDTKDESYYKYAITYLQKLDASGWASFDSYMNLALTYVINKDFSKSFETFDKMLELYGENYKIYKNMAFVEAERQAGLPVENRDYSSFKEYYLKADELFKRLDVANDNDTDMIRLSQAYDSLKSLGWIE